MSSRTHLFIDWFSATLSIPANEFDEVHARLQGMAETGALVAEAAAFSELTKHYRYAYRLMFDEETSCVIQISPRRRGRFMRIEWNPQSALEVHQDPMREIASALLQCIPSYSVQMLLDANITRIDWTFDLRRVPVDSILVFTPPLRRSLAKRYFYPLAEYSELGQVTSQEIGDPASDRFLTIYDKRAQMERGVAMGRITREVMIRRQPGQRRRIPTSWTRFELRLRDIGTLADWIFASNPFEDYRVTTYEMALGSSVDLEHWSHFVDSCKMRGAQAALSLIKNQRKRNKFRDALLVCDPPSWWNPSQLHRELIPALNNALGLSIPVENHAN